MDYEMILNENCEISESESRQKVDNANQIELVGTVSFIQMDNEV
jgi:hypothetical protein